MTQEAKLEFPNVVDAVRKRERCLWELGDALIQACGMPSKSGAHDGSLELLKKVSKELTDLKFDGYTVKFLARIIINVRATKSSLSKIWMYLDKTTEVLTPRNGNVDPDFFESLAEQLQGIETEAGEFLAKMRGG